MRHFTRGARYRHKNCLDIDIEILSVNYVDAKRTKMKIIYVNRHWQGGDFVIDAKASSVEVRSSDYPLWSRIK